MSNYIVRVGLTALWGLMATFGGGCGIGLDTLGLSSTSQTRYYVYVTTQGTDKKVYGFSFDPDSLNLTPTAQRSVAAGNAPEFAVADPAGRVLYVPRYNDGAIRVFAIASDTGALSVLQDSVATAANPTFIYADNTGSMLVVVGASALVIHSILPDGTLGTASTSVALSSGNPVGGAFSRDNAWFYLATDAGDVDRFTVNTSSRTLVSRVDDVGAAGTFTGFAAHPLIDALYGSVSGSQVTYIQVNPDKTAGVSSTKLLTNEGFVPVVRPDGQFLYVPEAAATISRHTFTDAAGTISGRTEQVLPTITGAVTPSFLQAIFDPKGQLLIVADHANPHLRLLSSNSASGALTDRQDSPVLLGGVAMGVVLVRTKATVTTAH